MCSVKLCISLCGIDLPQKYMTMRPRQIEDPIRETPILVFIDQVNSCVTSFTDTGDNINCGHFFRIQRYSRTDRADRIQHGTFTVPGAFDASPIACGQTSVFPRPMNCRRSVS